MGRNLEHILFMALAFMLILFIAIFGEYRHVKPLPNVDINLAPLPNVFVTNERFPRQMDDYLNDRFGLKKYFLSLYTKSSLLDTWSFDISGKTVIGKDGWLFMNFVEPDINEHSYENILNYQGREEFNDDNLKSIVNHISEIDIWCKSNGIKFIFIIPPMKHTIYSKYYSNVFGNYKNNNRYEKVVNALRNAGVDVVDVKSPINAQADSSKLYYKQDTHWTPYAAYLAYMATIEKVKKYYPDVYIVPQDDVTFSEGDFFLGNLNIVKKGNRFENIDKKITSVFNDNISVEHPNIEQFGLDTSMIEYLSISNVNNLKIFFVRDSFAKDLFPFFERSFGRLVATRIVWGISPLVFEKFILQEKPDILVLEVYEGYLKEIVDGQFNNPTEQFKHNIKF